MIVAVGKGIDRAHRRSQKKTADQVAHDLDPFVTREASSCNHGRQRSCHVVRASVVVFYAMSRVGGVGVRGKKDSLRVLPDS